MISHFSPNTNKFNGIFTYINTHYYSTFSDYIIFNSSSPLDQVHQTFQEILPPTGSNHLVIHNKIAFYQFTFKTFFMNVTSYSIKRATNDIRILSHWKIEASLNNSNWDLVDEVTDSSDQSVFNRNIKTGKIYNSFKLTKMNLNNDPNMPYAFDLYGFEIFGTICNPINCNLFVHKICSSKQLNFIPSLFVLFPIFDI